MNLTLFGFLNAGTKLVMSKVIRTVWAFGICIMSLNLLETVMSKGAFKQNSTGIFADEDDNDKAVIKLASMGYTKERIAKSTGLSLQNLNKILKRLDLTVVAK